MKRIGWIVFACLLSAVLLVGCGKDRDPYIATGDGLGDVIAPPSATEPVSQNLTLTYYPEETMNPLHCTDYTNKTVGSLLYQGLFSIDRQYHIQPVLCKNYRISEDMKSYTFYIEDATFSDGTALTAGDVLATLQAAKESQVYQGRFFHVTDIHLSEDGGVTVILDTPYENLPLLLDVPIVPERDIASTRPVGTGPYTLDETGGLAVLRRRQNWWCQSTDLVVSAQTIALLKAESIVDIRDDFHFNGLNLACADPGSDKFADYRCDYELWSCENGIFMYLAFSADSEAFQNDTLRTAVTYAIDRDMLAESYYRSFADSASLPASPFFPHYNQNLAAKYSYNSEKFAEAVEKSGMKGTEITFLVNSADSLRLRTARAIGEMLTAGGLTVKMSELSGNKYEYAIQTRQFDLYLGQTKLSPNMDLSSFFHTYGALSYGGVNDLTAYTLCLESLANYGNYYSLHKYVMENGLLCPVLFHSYAVYATRGMITDLNPARDHIFYYSIGKDMEHALLREEA